MVKKLASLFAVAGISTFGLYCIIAIIAASPYYNWRYAKSHGFLQWLAFGEVTATVDAFAWPLDLFLGTNSSPDAEAAGHVAAAIDAHLKALRLATDPNGETRDWAAIISLERAALSGAERADISRMNRWYPKFGDHFKDEFIDGLRLIIDNAQDGSTNVNQNLVRGKILTNDFGDWYRANLDGIRHGAHGAAKP